MSSIDADSQYTNIGSNFIYESKNINWLFKIDTELTSVSYNNVVNTYVAEENIVWYLYNFLEKTDDVGIYVDQLIYNLFIKADGTMAFDHMLKHFIDAYHITDATDAEYCNNAAIEYFYLFLLGDSKFKTIVNTVQKNWINIEYEDFYSSDILIKKLQHLPNFNRDYFLKQHNLLVETNLRYLTRKADFYDKFKNKTSNTQFDILEWAYIGWLLSKDSKERLDWFNKDVRLNKITELDENLCLR